MGFGRSQTRPLTGVAGNDGQGASQLGKVYTMCILYIGKVYSVRIVYSCHDRPWNGGVDRAASRPGQAWLGTLAASVAGRSDRKGRSGENKLVKINWQAGENKLGVKIN